MVGPLLTRGGCRARAAAGAALVLVGPKGWPSPRWIRGSQDLNSGRLIDMGESLRIRDIEDQRARRRAARELIGEYHEEQLRRLLENVRHGIERMDAGEIDPFELDELIHQYKRSAQKLWSFCGSGGSDWESAALTVEWWRENGEPETDWWETGRPRRRGA